MDWNNKSLTELEAIDVLKLNPKQVKFYSAMVKLASIGVVPSDKQLQYIHFLSMQPAKELTNKSQWVN